MAGLVDDGTRRERNGGLLTKVSRGVFEDALAQKFLGGKFGVGKVILKSPIIAFVGESVVQVFSWINPEEIQVWLRRALGQA